MNPIIVFVQKHPFVIVSAVSGATVWLFNNVITVMVSSLPAPTKDSGPKYIYWFKVANTVVGNLQRAHGSRIEDSPNFKDAVQKYLAQNGIEAPGQKP
jgi:hypothetical protein